MKKSFLKELSSLICTASGTGLGYMIAEGGSIAYIVGKEIMNLAYGLPIAPISDILKEYALYTSAAAFIGEVSGYVFHKKIWKALGGE
jgi:hypothetical protein